VRLFGGFAGHESSLAERAGLFADTLLSGDLAGDDDTGVLDDNSRHVLWGENADSSAVLDGFTIRGGFADGSSVPGGAGGGLMLLSSSPQLHNCRFSDNLASFAGGAIAALASPATLTRCTFLRNVAVARGGAVHAQLVSDLSLQDCVFSENVAERGGALSIIDSSPAIVRCTFVGNRGGTGAGLHISQKSTPLLLSSVFAGNEAATAAAVAADGGSPQVIGCLLAGNRAGSAAAVRVARGAGPLLSQCTLAFNEAAALGGGLNNEGGQPALLSCLLWGNTAAGTADESAQISGAGESTTVEHCLVQGLDALSGDGNIGGDPALGPSLAGSWTQDAQYDEDSGLTTLTDSSASWDGRSLAGRLLNPSIGQALQTVIVDNGRTSLTVLGDFRSLGPAGGPYHIHDYRPLAASPAVDSAFTPGLPADAQDLDDDGDVDEALPLDLSGQPRTLDLEAMPDCPQDPGTCGLPPVADIGAYEVQVTPPEGVIAMSDPPDGAIDARQPSSPDGSGPVGWDAVSLVFSGDPAGLLPESFTIEAAGGKPPAIAGVVVAGQQVTVLFDRPISPGACTTLRHRTSGARVRLGYLPADSSADGSSGPLDILTLIDGLNGVTPLAEWSCNIDRAGACAPLDILRLVDLLNGADAFDSWNGADLPQCP
jgi:hypothetical protein